MIDKTNYIIKQHKYADGRIVNQKYFRAQCSRCLKDKETYILKCQDEKVPLCQSCSAKDRNKQYGNPMSGRKQDCTKFRPTYTNVNYSDYKLITTKTGKVKRRYHMFCISCNKDRGYLAHNEATRNCFDCHVKSITKKSKEQKKIYQSLKANLNARFAARKLNKELGCFRWLPYTLDDLMKHLESKFEPWMNWDNHGNYNPNRKTWQIDHIIADANHVYSSVYDNDFKKCWALSNLQPLEAITNILKADH